MRLEHGRLACTVTGREARATRRARRVPTAMADPLPDFESSLAELEAIVTQLEHGDLALEESLGLFERGVELSRACHARLEDAERRIEVLTERGDVRPAPATLTTDADAR